MPLPFILGLLVGGGAVIAYNKRKKICSFIEQGTQNEHVQSVLHKGEELLASIKGSLPKPHDTQSTQANHDQHKDQTPC